MIVKDEEDVLERSLSCAKDIVEEIIIVDTGSTDRTKEIAAKFTKNIYDFKWINDFSAARNYAFSKATKEYIMWLDADDVIEEKDQESFKELKATIPPEVDSVMMEYHIHYDKAGKPTYSTMRNRLVKRDRNFQWKGAIHEYLDVHGVVAKSNTAIYHKKQKNTTNRNLNIYKDRLKNGDHFSPRDLFYYANELQSHQQIHDALKKYEEFLATKKGWVEDNIAACIQLAKCYAFLADEEKQMKSLFQSFSYDKPRAEVCCRLGEIFLNNHNDVEKAIFWYKLATNLGSPPDIRGLLYQPHTWTWLPHMQLSVCYEKIGEFKKAIHHSEKALEYYPEHYKIHHNLNYLKELDAQTETAQKPDSHFINQLFEESLQYFLQKDYFRSYNKLYQIFKKSPDNEQLTYYFAAFAMATGCKEVAQFYMSKGGRKNFNLFLQNSDRSDLLNVLLFDDNEKQKWEDHRRQRNMNEHNRFAVTAPLCSGDVLEVGCGNGDLSSVIAMHADRLFGVDIDPITIELARYKMYRYGLDNCYFALADGSRLEFAENSFDTVVLTEVLQQVMNPQLLIEEAIRVCKPEGKIVIGVPKGYSIPDPTHKKIITKDMLLEFTESYNQTFHLVNHVPAPYILGYFLNKKEEAPTKQTHNVTDHFLPPHQLKPLDFNEKVTVIIPTFNRSRSLIQSLESVLAQTYPNKEIIVVNDGSTDDTETVLKTYQDKVTYLTKENGGLSSAVNVALPKATGKYVWVFADDDIALPKKLELQVRKFQEDQNIGLIHTSAIYMQEHDGTKIYTRLWHARHIPRNAQLKEKLKGNYYFSPTVLVKKEALEKAGPFDERLRRAQDYDLWARISRFFKVSALPIPTVHYLVQPKTNNRETAEKTKQGDHVVINKIRKLPLKEVFPKEEGNTDELVYEVEALLERAIYMAHHGLIDEFCEDIEKAKEIASRSDELLNYSLKGLQAIMHLDKVLNKVEAPYALMNLFYLIDKIEKANQ
jgi:glycosyltransferase involved in cell wall biosynthesis/ubiquinone/menaquinone biosynthesis C-methylase UbiE